MNEEIASLADGVLSYLRVQGCADEPKQRKVLAAAREKVKRPRRPSARDEQIRALFRPGEHVRARHIAAELGCAPKRVRALLEASGAQEVARGLFLVAG